MFPTSAFNPIQMGFQYPGQHPTGSIYQSQFGGFNPQIPPPFQQPTPPRGQSLPAASRQYTPPGGPYIPASSRRHDQYPPSVPTQHHEYRHHGSKNKKHSKQQSVSPNDVVSENLYSDKEKDEHSRSHTPVLGSPSKQEESNNNDHEQQSQTIESGSGEISQVGTEEHENFNEKRQSRSKKKKHQRPEHYYNQFQPQTPPLYGELPSKMRVHQQPLYSGYNQAYEESVRRGDVYHKHAKRLARFPPEIKQKLLPHEDDRQNQYPYPGYSQPIFNGIHAPFNPYPPGYFPPTTPYNVPQRWSKVGPAEQEIHRLRSHIHTLESELNKLQKKLNKTTLNNNENNRIFHQTKHDETGSSPRQTPVIVELNNTTGETNRELSTKKKHRHREGSHRHIQQGQNIVPQSGENHVDSNIPNQQPIDSREHSHSNGNQILETEGKPLRKTAREETAAQLAHAAAAHVNARQQVPPPPPVQQQGNVPPQTQPIRGPAPHLPVGANIRYPNEPYQQRDIFNSNYNQSNNNEVFDNNEEQRNRRSADKILDAFERFYMNKSTTTPMKVKYIPEENNSNHFQQRNTNTNNNNNNNNRDRSISQCASSSSSSACSHAD